MQDDYKSTLYKYHPRGLLSDTNVRMLQTISASYKSETK